MAGKSDDNGIGGLPEEWGEIHIPDDPAELEFLAIKVRRELRKEQRRELRLPYTVLAITIVITLASMFLVPWMGTTGRVDPVDHRSPTTPVCSPDCDTPSSSATTTG